MNFLNLGNAYIEKDLEQANLVELEKFILEMGKGICLTSEKDGYRW